MCTVCGCGDGETRLEGEAHEHLHVHEDGTVHAHAHHHDGAHAHAHEAAALAGAHAHDHVHEDGTRHAHAHVHAGAHAHDHGHAHGHDHGGHHHAHDHGDTHYGHGPAGAHVPGMSQARMVQIEQDILGKNNDYASANRQWFDEHGVFALNLVSSPGSGKTTLLVATVERLKAEVPLVVVEGDQQTANDAERIRATGARALQINTGKGCHLDAHMVGHARERLAPADNSLFLIENVGNLVCPSAFALGEHHKVVILSVTEGEDKPLKYPDMFRAADLMLLNKCDLLPHLDFDADLAEANARTVNPGLTVLRVSARSGEGMDGWLGWIRAGLARVAASRVETVDALKARIAALEAELARR